MNKLENKNDRIGLSISVGLHAALLILFIFLLAWKEPIPPIPEYGIELNFGLDQAGFGEVQPETPANNVQEINEDPEPEATESPEETVEETEVSSTPEEIPEVEDVVETPPVEEKVTTQPDPSPAVVEEKPVEQPAEKPKEEKKAPQLNPAATYPNKTNSDSKGDQAGNPSNNNQGDQPGTTGDQGDPDGTLDSRALYGKPGGGGGGAALDMAGWNWDFLPRPKDTSNEGGRIVFEIKIDEYGEIISVRTLEKTVSDALVKVYRAEVLKLTFSPTSGNARPAPTSVGRITFIIRSR